jgi:hypothetical protein
MLHRAEFFLHSVESKHQCFCFFETAIKKQQYRKNGSKIKSKVSDYLTEKKSTPRTMVAGGATEAGMLRQEEELEQEQEHTSNHTKQYVVKLPEFWPHAPGLLVRQS